MKKEILKLKIPKKLFFTLSKLRFNYYPEKDDCQMLKQFTDLTLEKFGFDVYEIAKIQQWHGKYFEYDTNESESEYECIKLINNVR